MRITHAPPTSRRRRSRLSLGALSLALTPALALGVLACTSKQPRPKPDEQPVLAPIDPLDYVPADATAINSVSVKAAYGSWLDRWFLPEELRALQQHAASCELDLTKIERVVSAAGADERTLVVLVGPRIGDPERLRCVHNAYESAALEAPFRVVDGPGGAPELALEDYGLGFIADERALVISSSHWAATARELAQGIGQRVGDGRLRPLLDEVDQNREMWFVANLETNDDGVFPVTSLVGTATLSAGLELDLNAIAANEDDAEKTTEMLRGVAQMMPSMIAAQGGHTKDQEQLTEVLRDAVEITQKGARTHVSVSIERAPMEIIAARFADMKRSFDSELEEDSVQKPEHPPRHRP